VTGSAPVLVAPDSFKGTFAAAEVARVLARGLRDGGRHAVELPVADGGEGTLDALLGALGGERRTARVEDPLGREVEAEFALLGDGRTAVVEMARASGLWRLAADERDAWSASTRGTGQLIAAAAASGAARIVVAAGGSATTDGGAGAIEALQDAGLANVPVSPGSRHAPAIVVACDVRTPWERAARVFAPQKGADPRTVRLLERRLDELAARLGRDPRGLPLTGAGGGLAGGLWAELGAELVPGAALVLDSVGFDAHMREARFVVTGEGRLDEQTLAGKLVGELATRCRQGGVGCHAVVGENALDGFRARVLDLASVTEARTLDEIEAAGRALAGL
jgi:glycerate 2-kinase